MTPDVLANELGISAKTLRSWLRRQQPRSPVAKHQRWELDAATTEAARAHFKSAGPAPVTRTDTIGASHDADFDVVLADFQTAEIYRRSDVLASPCPVPQSPGVYGWWFRTLPTELDVSRCLVRDGMPLLYTGISPKRPPTNGRPPSSQTLQDRIKYHYSGNAEGSTLRKTLGILLSNQIGLELRRVGSGKRMTFGKGEQALSMWMAENAFVSWIVHPQPWLVEATLIAQLDVPLNLDGNTHNAFHPSLRAARAEAVARARGLPVVANPGVGGR
jgi:hypothetical protein